MALHQPDSVVPTVLPLGSDMMECSWMGVLDGEVFIVSSCILSQMLKASVTSL
jgi:hypothetical protein